MRTQIDGGRAVSVLSCVLCRARPGAPGDHLARRSAQIQGASIDGRPARLRHQGDGILLELPGHTQQQLELVLTQDLPGGLLRVRLPDLGGLSVTATAWRLAVDGPLLVRADLAGEAMPLEQEPATRLRFSPFYGWLSGGSWRDAITAPVILQQGSDPRRLAPMLTASGAPPAAVGPAMLALHGQLLAGMRIGSGELRLEALSLGRQRAAFALGAVLGLVLGAFLAWRLPWLHVVAAVLGCTGIAGAVLMAGGATSLVVEVLAGGAAWSGLGLLLVAPVRLLLTHARAKPLLACLLAGTALVLAPTPGAAETAPPQIVVMGYDHLDAQHRPQGVVVALSPVQSEALGLGKQGQDLGGVACGAASFVLESDGTQVAGTCTVPLAVLAQGWQEFELDLGAAGVSAVRVEALPEASPAIPSSRLAWSVRTGADGGSLLEVRVRDPLALRLVVSLAWAKREEGSNLSIDLPGSRGGGSVEVHAPSGWELSADDRLRLPALPASRSMSWTLALPVARGSTKLVLSREKGPQSPGTLDIGHQLVVRIFPSGLSWQDSATIALRGQAPLAGLQMQLPPQLQVTSVAGEGIAGWWQQAGTLAVRWSVPKRGPCQLVISGVIARASTGNERGDGSALVLPSVANAREHGRLALVHGQDARFEQPAGLDRAGSAPGEDLVAVWTDAPAAGAGRVSWLALGLDSLRLRERIALVLGEDRVRAYLHLELSGSGACEQLRLHLPGAWSIARSTDAPSAVAATSSTPSASLIAELVGEGAERVLVLRGNGPLSGGATFDLMLEHLLPGLEDFSAPDLRPSGPLQPLLEHQGLVVGDAGDPRLQAAAATAAEELEDASRMAPPPQAALRLQERWRFARETPGAEPLRLHPVRDQPIVQLEADHYLRLDDRSLRIATRITATPRQGAVQDLVLLLGEGMELESVTGADLGWWRLEGMQLHLHLSRPSSAPFSVALATRQGWHEGRIRLLAISSGDLQPLLAQHIALAIHEDAPLVRWQPEGLESDQPGSLSDQLLPSGIDASLLDASLHAVRRDWSLSFTRGAVESIAGEDALAPVVDLRTVVAPDGELRSMARWSVINRSRRELALELPDTVQLWEVRVDGMSVAPHQDAQDAHLAWIPVPLERPGQAATTVDVIWRQPPSRSGMVQARAPVLRDLHLVTSLWTFDGGPGTVLAWRGGSLQPCDLATVLAERARRVMDDLARLRSVAALAPPAVARARAELDRILDELDDRITEFGRQPPSAAEPVLGALRTSREQVGAELARLDQAGALAARRRAGLGLDQEGLVWEDHAGARAPQPGMSAWAVLTMPVCMQLPWEVGSSEPAQDLGEGLPAPGLAGDAQGVLTGVELVPGAGGVQLSCRGQGGELSCDFSIVRAHARMAWGAWAMGLAGALVMLAPLLLARRARRAASTTTQAPRAQRVRPA